MQIDLSKNKPQSSSVFTNQAINMLLGGGEYNIKQLNISLLDPFVGQPFRPYTQEKLKELAEDIKQNGILSPVIVRPIEGGRYQILAGHNRTNAAELAGLDVIPCIVKECDDDLAKLIVVNTNLNQRQELLPSEKAYAYKMQLEAIKHQGQATSRQVGEKLLSAEIIAQSNNESTRQIQRYIRLTYLTENLLSMVDNGLFAFMTGVNLSYLTENNQKVLYTYIVKNHKAIKLEQAEALRQLNSDGDFSPQILHLFFNPPKVEKKKASYAFKTNVIKNYIPDFENLSDLQINDYLIKALEHYSSVVDKQK